MRHRIVGRHRFGVGTEGVIIPRLFLGINGRLTELPAGIALTLLQKGTNLRIGLPTVSRPMATAKMKNEEDKRHKIQNCSHPAMPVLGKDQSPPIINSLGHCWHSVTSLIQGRKRSESQKLTINGSDRKISKLKRLFEIYQKYRCRRTNTTEVGVNQERFAKKWLKLDMSGGAKYHRA
jgi:hypothetical protein